MSTFVLNICISILFLYILFYYIFYFILDLPDKEYIKQVVANITKEEMKNTVNLLLKGLIIDNHQVLIHLRSRILWKCYITLSNICHFFIVF